MASEPPPPPQQHRAEEEDDDDDREEQKQQQEESSEEEEEEEYIDIDVGSSAFLYYTFDASSPPLPDDPFEFHLSFHHPHHDAAAGASPADELFYKGKLLPLHLPPRLQMLEKLLLDDCRDHPPPPPSSSWHSHSPHEAPPQGKPGATKGPHRSRLVRATRRYLASLFGRRRTGGGARVEEQRRSVSGIICRYLPVANYAPSSGSASVHSESSRRSTAAPKGDGGGRRDGDEEEEESSIQRAIAYCKSSQSSPTATNVVDSRTAAGVRLAKTPELC